MKKQLSAPILFLCLVALLNWSEQLLQTGWLGYLSKPLLMPPLFFYLWQATPLSPLRNGVLFALLFSWFGDLLLLFEQEHELFFAAGLGAFLIAHLGYALSFGRYALKQGHRGVPKLPVALALLLTAGAVYAMLFPALGALRIPVGVYVLTILGMGLTARQVQEQSAGSGGRLLFGGALLFMLSDSLLATSKFLTDFPLDDLLVMLTYVLAQTLLTEGTKRLHD